MLRFAALIFGDGVFGAFGQMMTWFMRAKGIRVGSGLRLEGVPRLILDGPARNIEIGDNVRITGDIILKVREQGRIIIGDNVLIEFGSRLVAARDGRIEIGSETASRAKPILSAAPISSSGARYCSVPASPSTQTTTSRHVRPISVTKASCTRR